MTAEKTSLRPIDKPFFGRLRALYLSFFSRELYVDVGKRWKGFGFSYLLLLLFLMTIPFTVRVIIEFNRYFDEQLVSPLQQLPQIYIQNGQVSLDKTMPYFIKNKAGQVVSIVDTTGTVTTMDSTYQHLSTLITKDKFFYRMPSIQFFFTQGQQDTASPVYVEKLSQRTNEVFDGPDFVRGSGLYKIKLFSDLIFYPTIVFVFFAIYSVFFLAFALLGQLISSLFFHFSISYRQSLRLLMVSSSAHISVFLLALTFNALFRGMGVLLITLLAGYFSFAVLSLKRSSLKLVLS